MIGYFDENRKNEDQVVVSISNAETRKKPSMNFSFTEVQDLEAEWLEYFRFLGFFYDSYSKQILIDQKRKEDLRWDTSAKQI